MINWTNSFYFNIIVELASGDTIFLRSFKSNKIEEFIDFVKKY